MQTGNPKWRSFDFFDMQGGICLQTTREKGQRSLYNSRHKTDIRQQPSPILPHRLLVVSILVHYLMEKEIDPFFSETLVFGLQRVSSSMLFDHTLSDAEISESFSEAQETLRILQQESSVTPSTPELFNKFAKQLKKLDYEKLQRIQTFARTDKAK